MQRGCEVKKVLIIEDEANVARAEQLILQDHFQTHIAGDGETGLEMAKKLKPDLIVLDLMLPKRGGYDICFNLRQDDALKAIKILMVTAKNQQIDKNKGLMVGADDYLTKPFEASHLLERVHNLLK